MNILIEVVWKTIIVFILVAILSRIIGKKNFFFKLHLWSLLPGLL